MGQRGKMGAFPTAPKISRPAPPPKEDYPAPQKREERPAPPPKQQKAENVADGEVNRQNTSTRRMPPPRGGLPSGPRIGLPSGPKMRR